MKNVLFVVFVIVVVTALLFFGKNIQKPAANVSGAQGSAGSSAVQGRSAPDFELKVLEGNGKTLRLSSLKGKAVLVNFWATWCEPCKIEMPWLVDLQKEYGPQGLQIIGVAMDDTDEKTIADFTRKMGVNYPVLIGKESVADLYGGIEGLPMSYFVDRSGKIVSRELGLRSESVLVDHIKESLGKGGDSSKSASASAK